jgi:hypothetical protein
MTKENELIAIKFHWYWYLKCGGIGQPLPDDDMGFLKSGGLEHWASFLRTAKEYIVKYPKDRKVLEEFIPHKLVKMLIGE